MSTDATNNRNSQYTPLSFDNAGAPSAATCVKCGALLPGSYHTSTDQMACSTCRVTAEEQQRGAAGAEGIVRAFAFGLGAAIVGAGAYYAFVKVTNIEWALITGLVGLGVGKAVNIGGRGLGGRKYQLIAVLLAWMAMGGAYFPFLAEGAMTGASKAQKEAVVEAQARADSIDEANDAVAEPDSAALAASANAHEAVKRIKNFKVPLGAILIASIIGIFTTPFLVTLMSPLSGVIMAFALYRAWKVNRGEGVSMVSVAGPFRLQGPPPSAAA